MSDIIIRKQGVVGWITLNRPKALNALTYAMIGQIEVALDQWRADSDVALILIDAEGDRAFCAGGDIADLYATGRAGDFKFGQQFWADEYRMNAKLFEFPKPVVSFLQGFTMGGGVGAGCHASHRIVCENSQIAMPECGIGLVPDVGGSLLLAQAPGKLGAYLGLTTDRMKAADAIYAGFADYYVPQADWADLKATLAKTGNWKQIFDAKQRPAIGSFEPQQSWVDRMFNGDIAQIFENLNRDGSEAALSTLKKLSRPSPLSLSVTTHILDRLAQSKSIRDALTLEYRFTYRAMEHGDFLEGIRAQVIDKDRNPKWRHADPTAVPANDVARMLAPLGANGLKLEEALR
jgi:enoyl-CoA hydratase